MRGVETSAVPSLTPSIEAPPAWPLALAVKGDRGKDRIPGRKFRLWVLEPRDGISVEYGSVEILRASIFDLLALSLSLSLAPPAPGNLNRTSDQRDDDGRCGREGYRLLYCLHVGAERRKEEINEYDKERESYSRAETSPALTENRSTAPHHSSPPEVARGDETARTPLGPRAKSEPRRATEREPLAVQVAMAEPLPAVCVPERADAAAGDQ